MAVQASPKENSERSITLVTLFPGTMFPCLSQVRLIQVRVHGFIGQVHAGVRTCGPVPEPAVARAV